MCRHHFFVCRQAVLGIGFNRGFFHRLLRKIALGFRRHFILLFHILSFRRFPGTVYKVFYSPMKIRMSAHHAICAQGVMTAQSPVHQAVK